MCFYSVRFSGHTVTVSVISIINGFRTGYCLNHSISGVVGIQINSIINHVTVCVIVMCQYVGRELAVSEPNGTTVVCLNCSILAWDQYIACKVVNYAFSSPYTGSTDHSINLIILEGYIVQAAQSVLYSHHVQPVIVLIVKIEKRA